MLSLCLLAGGRTIPMLLGRYGQRQLWWELSPDSHFFPAGYRITPQLILSD